MLYSELLFLFMIIIPLVFGLLCWFFFNNIKAKFILMITGVLLTCGINIFVIIKVMQNESFTSQLEWFFIDSLSAYNLAILTLVFIFTSIYAINYFKQEINDKKLHLKQAGKFTFLWLSSFAAMILVLISNNIAIIWVGIEATTLITAFLISLHQKQVSIEAMWKYLIICSVGVAFAFIGTIFTVASAKGLAISMEKLLFWTNLNEHAGELNNIFVKAGFIFLVIGYGTKAGLSPMHTWLPDAHSQAPAPVSALFSGFLLSEAIYCITRFIPVVEKATQFSGWSLSILNILGLLSLGFAAIFIVFQKDLKRLLAYSSIEHVGIITFGLGLGGFGTFAALFHTLNHSLCKTLCFFATGKIGQQQGTHTMKKITALLKISPVWGTGFLISFLALLGIAPFAIFSSELQIIKTAIYKNTWVPVIIFLSAITIIFIGALKHLLAMLAGEKDKNAQLQKAGLTGFLLIIIMLGLLFLLGLHIPEPLAAFISRAAAIINGGK